MTPLWKPCLHIVMTDKILFGLTVVWIPLSIHFGYMIGCVQGSKHSSNNINFSTCKQHSTGIFMVFVSIFSGEKF